MTENVKTPSSASERRGVKVATNPMAIARLDSLREMMRRPASRIDLYLALSETIAEIDRLLAKLAERGAHYGWSEALVVAADAMRRRCRCESASCWPESRCESASCWPESPCAACRARAAYDEMRMTCPRREERVHDASDCTCEPMVPGIGGTWGHRCDACAEREREGAPR